MRPSNRSFLFLSFSFFVIFSLCFLITLSTKYFVDFYDDGVVRKTGSHHRRIFGDSIRTGEWKYYNENGTLTRRERWNSGVMEGMVTEWHPNGMLKCLGTVSENMEIGRWFFFSEKGILERDIQMREIDKVDTLHR